MVWSMPLDGPSLLPKARERRLGFQTDFLSPSRDWLSIAVISQEATVGWVVRQVKVEGE